VSRIEDKDTRKREQTRLRVQKHRAKGAPDTNRPVRIYIKIEQPELWRRACEGGERESLVSITERVIDEHCREQKRQEQEALWEKVSKTRTGAMDREAAVADIDADGNWAVADRREAPPPRPMKRPEDWTDEEWEEHLAEWREACEEWESRENDMDNPETGKSRRVNTRHNWEWDK
jgi:hypothetical protein